MTPSGRVYGYQHALPSHSHSYLLPHLRDTIARKTFEPAARSLDYGCGNGALTAWLASVGFTSFGVDLSESGIALARQAVPDATFSNDVSSECLAKLGPFDLVLCMEVIAHCYSPAAELEKIFSSLRPGGTLILSTPYHSYLKNLAMAVTGRLSSHLDTLWAGAYVHFFTYHSINTLLEQAGFSEISMVRAGRIPVLAKSMILTCEKPA